MLARVRSKRLKEFIELRYWTERQATEGVLENSYYAEFYTRSFDLDPLFYAGKRILDIGCGPRGSLEWADMAAERVGLDPLAEKYLELGADAHQMTYVASGSESIPFPDDHFDVVCSFNSLDHVADLDQTVREITRVICPGGLFLLLTDVNHDPTLCEPISLSWDVGKEFESGFEILEERQYEKGADGLYNSVREATPYDHTDPSDRYGIVSLKLRKRSAPPDLASG
jgi:SAM-dependent methyltransferase